MNTCAHITVLDYESRWDPDWMGEGSVGGTAAQAEAGVWKVFAHGHCHLLVFAPQVNFGLFVGIIIILVQKLQSPDTGGNESSVYL